jgi:hypothetical protein
MEVDGNRHLRPESLDTGDVARRSLGREGRCIPGRERRAILGEQRLGLRALCRDRLDQAVVPGADGIRDALLQLRCVGMRGRAVATADDELHAHQRTVGKVGVECGNAALVRLRQQSPNALAHSRCIPVARHVDEHCHEPIEAVDAGEHAHAWPELEVENAFRPLPQVVGLNLEQLVARERLQHVEQRLAVVACGRIAAQVDDRRHLVTEQRDLARRGGVCLRREEPNEAHLTVGIAKRAPGLDAHAVHVDPPVHAALDARLGDKQGEGAGHRAGIDSHTTWYVHVGASQQAEPLGRRRCEVAAPAIAGEAILARAEEREIADRKPAQERNRFLDGL